MRRDYYVVPPNRRAPRHLCPRSLRIRAHAQAWYRPFGGLLACYFAKNPLIKGCFSFEMGFLGPISRKFNNNRPHRAWFWDSVGILLTNHQILKKKAFGFEIPFLSWFQSKRWAKPNLCGLEPQLIKLEFIIYLPKLKVSMGALQGP